MVSKRRSNVGEKHPLSKLSDDDVNEIRKSPQRGKDLAERFGVTQV